MAKNSQLNSQVPFENLKSLPSRIWNIIGEWQYIFLAGTMALSVACSSGSQKVSIRNGGAGSEDSIKADGVELKFSAGESNDQDNGLNLGSQRKALALIELNYVYFNPPSASTGVAGKVMVGYDLSATTATKLSNTVKVPLGARVVFSDVGIREFRVDPLDNEAFIDRSTAVVANANGALTLSGVTNGKQYLYAINLVKPAEIPSVTAASATINVPFTFSTTVSDCLNNSDQSNSVTCGTADETIIETGAKLVVESGQSSDTGVNAPLLVFDKVNTGLAAGSTFSAGTSPISTKAMTVTKVTLRFTCTGDTCPTQVTPDIRNSPHMVINGVSQPSPKVAQNVNGVALRLFNSAGARVTDVPTGAATYKVELDVGNIAVAQNAESFWKNDLSFTVQRVEGNKMGTGKFELRNFVVKNY